MNFKNYDFKRLSLITGLFSLFAILAVLPAFADGHMKLPFDGNVHLSRFESIYEALANRSIPSDINFIGFKGGSTAYNSLYPWITGLIFVLPRFIIQNRLHAIMLGYFAINMLAMINMYLLTRELTNKIILRFLGVLLYQLSAYHFMIMYARVAMGELFTYTFLPLVFTGLLKIYKKDKLGFVFLGLGMSLIFNSHILSTITTVLILIVIVFVRIIRRKFSLFELKQYCYALLISVPMSIYSLFNFVKVYFNNDIEPPYHLLQPINTSDMWQAILNNSIVGDAPIFNIGLIETILLVLLIIPAILTGYSSWKLWWYSAIGIFIGTLNWFPWESKTLIESPIGSIQFLGRLLTYVSLFLAVAIVLLFEENEKYTFTIDKLSIIIIPLLLVSMSASYSHEHKMDYPANTYMHNNKNFEYALKYGEAGLDYPLRLDKATKKIPLKKFDVDDAKQTYNNITIHIKSMKTKKVRLNIPIYRGVNYTVKINGKTKSVASGKNLIVTLRQGKNVVSVTSNPTKLQYVLLMTSVISIILATVYSFLLIFKGRAFRIKEI